MLSKLCVLLERNYWQQQVDKFWHSWEVMQLQTQWRQVRSRCDTGEKDNNMKKQIIRKHKVGFSQGGFFSLRDVIFFTLRADLEYYFKCMTSVGFQICGSF